MSIKSRGESRVARGQSGVGNWEFGSGKWEVGIGEEILVPIPKSNGKTNDLKLMTKKKITGDKL
jgi:hypothetical protein